MNDVTFNFIKEHLNDDVKCLALSAFPEDVDKNFVINQIYARQLLRHKLPSWAADDNLLFPSHLSVEQCSSELTALYKAFLVRGDTFADLTGGLGVDACFMSKSFEISHYVECQQQLCVLAEHNFATLGVNIKVFNDTAESFLQHCGNYDCIFLDPARRDNYGRKMISLHDCSPDVSALLPPLFQKTGIIMLKLSPMIDISMILRELSDVAEIHVVAVKNECKEILVLMRQGFTGKTKYCCSDLKDNNRFVYQEGEEDDALCQMADNVGHFLYEPNAALMKGGAFKLIGQRYGLSMLHKNSHLYTSDVLSDSFPGRVFSVQAYSDFNKKVKKELLKDLTAASVIVRNFPVKADELRKMYNLKENSQHFVIATTMKGNRKIIINALRLY